MKLSLKVCVALLAMIMVFAVVGTTVFAALDAKGLINQVEQGENNANIDSSTLSTKAGNVLSLIRTAAIILGTVIIAFLGLKYMMGSVEEKAKYKESMMPLVIGIIVLMAATSIATLLFTVAD